MSQYLSDNSQRFYSSSYEYSPSHGNYFVLQPHRNPPVREPSLNRNNSASSSLVLKPGKIQENLPGKIRRESSMRNSADFKENDPYVKNSHPPSHTSRLPFTTKDQNDYGAEYEAKGPYCNPLAVKREKMMKDLSRQKIPSHQQTRQTLTQSLKSSSNSKHSFYQQQYQQLSEKVTKMESQMKDSLTSIAEHKTKIQKLQEVYQLDVQRQEKSKRHSRSISNPNSGTPTFKQLSDIMSLIEETKNYQIRNSEEYRKMIEEFRSTILQFREELNKTVKKSDIEAEIHKIKQVLSNDTVNGLTRKPSLEYGAGHTYVSRPKELDLAEKIERQIQIMRASIEKLEEQGTSIKADMVKFSVRDKKMGDEIHVVIGEVSKKLQNLEKELIPFSQTHLRKGPKNEGVPICFKVSQQLSPSPSDPRRPQKSPFMSHSSVVQYEQGSKLSLPAKGPLTVSQKTYYIDKEGYLLDKDNFYLLNERNEQIRLSQREVDMLRKFKVLQ